MQMNLGAPLIYMWFLWGRYYNSGRKKELRVQKSLKIQHLPTEKNNLLHLMALAILI